MPVMPQAPMRPSATSFSQAGMKLLDVGRPARCGPIDVGAGVVAVGNDVGMQEEEVDTLEPHACKALIEAAHNIAFDLSSGRSAKSVLGRYSDASGQPAFEGRADNPLRLAVAVCRRHVEQRDAAVDRGAYRRDAFIARSRSPELANPAATKCKHTHRPKPAKHAGFHGILGGDGRKDSVPASSSALWRSVESYGGRSLGRDSLAIG